MKAFKVMKFGMNNIGLKPMVCTFRAYVLDSHSMNKETCFCGRWFSSDQITRVLPRSANHIVTNEPIRVNHPNPGPPIPNEQIMDWPKMFAIVSVRNRQWKVLAGDRIMMGNMKLDIAQQVIFDRVLLLGGRDWSVIGRPYIPKALVYATVEEDTRCKKVLVFKKKRRKGYRRMKGHRSQMTIMKIDKIEYDGQIELAPENDPPLTNFDLYEYDKDEYDDDENYEDEYDEDEYDEDGHDENESRSQKKKIRKRFKKKKFRKQKNIRKLDM